MKVFQTANKDYDLETVAVQQVKSSVVQKSKVSISEV